MMEKINDFFASKLGIIFAGAFIGIVAVLLQEAGNPGNMGFCVACFERDIVGALGFHRAGVVQYIRPEIIGFVLGSLITALLFKEYRARSGSAPMIRFILGFFAMIGALVFLGCPWRANLRLAGGDLTAIAGLAGLAAGVFVGTLFVRNGFNLGRSQKARWVSGLVLPGMMVALLVLLIWQPNWDDPTKAVFFSIKGPGAMAAPIAMGLGIGLAVGFIAQRTRFCTIGGIRDAILIKDYHLFLGIVSLIIAALVMNVIFGNLNNIGFDNQPVAHNDHLWNFMGMVLSGLCFVLAGGCPGRQLILSGEGDGDAATFVVGMMVAAAFAHNFFTASSPAGVGNWGPGSVILGIVVVLLIGFFMREKL